MEKKIRHLHRTRKLFLAVLLPVPLFFITVFYFSVSKNFMSNKSCTWPHSNPGSPLYGNDPSVNCTTHIHTPNTVQNFSFLFLNFPPIFNLFYFLLFLAQGNIQLFNFILSQVEGVRESKMTLASINDLNSTVQRALVVAPLIPQLLPTPEVRTSNPVIGNFI